LCLADRFLALITPAQRWQASQQKAVRAPKEMREIGLPHRRQGWPRRS
jgi:hypothetical protein